MFVIGNTVLRDELAQHLSSEGYNVGVGESPVTNDIITQAEELGAKDQVLVEVNEALEKDIPEISRHISMVLCKARKRLWTGYDLAIWKKQDVLKRLKELEEDFARYPPSAVEIRRGLHRKEEELQKELEKAEKDLKFEYKLVEDVD